MDPRTDRSDAHPDPFRQATMCLAGFVAAVVLVVTGGLAGVAMGTHGDAGMATGAATAAETPGMAFMLDGVPMEVAAHYHFAAAHPNAYAMIPCFCGCQATLDHKNLHDCFVRPEGGWEVHASGCAVCVDESTTVRRMLRQGRTKAEIRDAVLADYGMLSSDPGTA